MWEELRHSALTILLILASSIISLVVSFFVKEAYFVFLALLFVAFVMTIINLFKFKIDFIFLYTHSFMFFFAPFFVNSVYSILGPHVYLEYPLFFLNTFFYLSFVATFLYGSIILLFKSRIEKLRAYRKFDDDFVLLEIIPHKDETRGPRFMEAFFDGIRLTGGEGTKYAKLWVGKRRPVFTFEIMSKGGRVRMFIRTQGIFRQLVEDTFYAQYPTSELLEAKDYVLDENYVKNFDDYDWNAREFKLNKSDGIPITTYIDLEIESIKETSESKDQNAFDNLSAFYSFLGNLKTDEQVWMQFIVRAAKEKKITPKILQNEEKDPASKALSEIEKQITDHRFGEGSSIPAGVEKTMKTVVDSIKRNSYKNKFDVGLRGLYFVKKPAEVTPSGINAFFKQFAHSGSISELNSIIPGPEFDSKWEERYFKRVRNITALKNYILRSFFRGPAAFDPVREYAVLTSEELATIFHIPQGSAIQSVTVNRNEHKSVDAPSNLPVKDA